MLVVISPAKSLDYESPLPTKKNSQPSMLADSAELIAGLRKLAPQDIASLMGVSEKIALENFDRFKAWKMPFTKSNARPAVFAFKGDVYLGMDAYKLKTDDFTFAQEHLRILSGLYGLLKPLDLIQAYRLEMGTAWRNKRGANLYEFWGDKITQELNKQLKKIKSELLVNLASNEYFKAVNKKELNAEVVTPVFKDYKNGEYKVVSFFAKKARGLMSAYIVRERIEKAGDLKKFKAEGYRFNSELSRGNHQVFTRKQ